MPPPTSMTSRKRTRSTNTSQTDNDHEQTTSTSTVVSSQSIGTVPPKRQRNNPSSSSTTTTTATTSGTSHLNYSLRNRSTTADTRHSAGQATSIDSSTDTQRYNLRPRQAQIHSSESSNLQVTTVSRRIRRQNPSTSIISTQHEPSTSSTGQPRQYRLLYISDDDEQPTIGTQPATAVVDTTFNLMTDDEDDGTARSPLRSRRIARSAPNNTHNTRSRTSTDSTNAPMTENTDFPTTGVAHVRLNRAIEIVIDSIQSLEGAVNNFDQLVFGLIYGRLSTRNDFENIEGMIRLSRILNLSFPSRLTQDEIDALPKIKFITKPDATSSLLLVEKCPICLTEFYDEEIINKLHCTHLFHLGCISTWLSENDSCPTCRRKVNAD